jgi:acetyl esterase/lipase
LTTAGVAVEERRYPTLIHAFYNLAGVSPAVQPAIVDAAAALRRALAGPE